MTQEQEEMLDAAERIVKQIKATKDVRTKLYLQRSFERLEQQYEQLYRLGGCQ